MKALIFGILAMTAAIAAPAGQTFTGTIADSMCARAHTMRMGPTDADCTKACVEAHDADYVLFDGKTVQVLSEHPKLEQFAGKKVTITGTVDSQTKKIRIESIAEAK
jgi:hypothetical protein